MPQKFGMYRAVNHSEFTMPSIELESANAFLTRLDDEEFPMGVAIFVMQLLSP